MCVRNGPLSSSQLIGYQYIQLLLFFSHKMCCAPSILLHLLCDFWQVFDQHGKILHKKSIILLLFNKLVVGKCVCFYFRSTHCRFLLCCQNVQNEHLQLNRELSFATQTRRLLTFVTSAVIFFIFLTSNTSFLFFYLLSCQVIKSIKLSLWDWLCVLTF